MNDNKTIDEAAQAIDDHQSMVESRTDREIFAEMNEMDQPKVTDFTTTVPAEKSGFDVRVKLDSRWVTVGNHPTREDAERAELALSQVMIEYRTKRNAWENSHANS